jgi:microcystin-dependent protein
MGTPFLGEIKIISWNFAPQGWAFCNGQFLPINQNQALFSILGTMYGGNGQTTFALPDLRAKVPIHRGTGFTEGQAGGENAHTITLSEMPTHNHGALASQDSNVNNSTSPANNFYSATADNTQLYFTGNADSAMNNAIISNIGGSQPHENRQPFLVLNFIIALIGVFPSQN